MSKLSTLRPIYIQQKIIYIFPDAAELKDDKLQIYKNVASSLSWRHSHDDLKLLVHKGLKG